MVSPMREKRVWPPQDKEDRAETIAFEQTVAVVKETVARSGQVLSSAKTDLSDHQRWVRDQAAAVEADRARHDRWLQRQRERQEAFARREQARLRRRQMRQRAIQAVRDAISAVALSISSAVLLVVGKTIGGLNYIDALATSGIKWVGRQIRDGALHVARLVARAGSWIGRKAGESGRATARALAAGFSFVAAKVGVSARATGRGLWSGLSFVGDKSSALLRFAGKAVSAGSSSAAVRSAALARSTGRALSTGASFAATNSAVLARSIGSALSKGAAFTVTSTSILARDTGRIAAAGAAWTSAKVHEIAPPVARFLSICFVGIGARATDLSRATVRGIEAGSSVVATKTAIVARSTGVARAPAFARIRVTAYAVAPSLAERIGKAGNVASNFAADGADRIRTALASAMPRGPFAQGGERRTAEPVAEGALASATQSADSFAPGTLPGEKALSLPRQIGGFELSQMLIVAGTLLLVLGGLMLGGGLILRAGTPSQSQIAPAAPDSLVWFFEHEDRPLAERSVFIFTSTPDGVRIKGFAISAENKSDQPLTGVEGILKPDVEGPDMPLSVSVDMPRGEATLHPAEVSANEAGAGVVPAGSVFRLIFPFPDEPGSDQQGVTAEEVAQTFGGLMLKVHYGLAGKQKSFMHYLSPAMLKDQLTEIEAGAKGS